MCLHFNIVGYSLQMEPKSRSYLQFHSSKNVLFGFFTPFKRCAIRAFLELLFLLRLAVLWRWSWRHVDQGHEMCAYFAVCERHSPLIRLPILIEESPVLSVKTWNLTSVTSALSWLFHLRFWTTSLHIHSEWQPIRTQDNSLESKVEIYIGCACVGFVFVLTSLRIPKKKLKKKCDHTHRAAHSLHFTNATTLLDAIHSFSRISTFVTQRLSTSSTTPRNKSFACEENTVGLFWFRVMRGVGHIE